MFEWKIRVYWEDTDAGGIVFYANYLKFFERARTEWLRSLGLGQQQLRDQTGGMFVVTRTAVDYLRSARLDDELSIHTTIARAARASLQLDQSAWRGTECLCRGQITIGWVEAGTLRPRRIAPEIARALQIEGNKDTE